MILYLDTSSLLKLYLEEPGTHEVEFLSHDLKLMRAATKELKKHKR